jgi:hypothetical protein
MRRFSVAAYAAFLCAAPLSAATDAPPLWDTTTADDGSVIMRSPIDRRGRWVTYTHHSAPGSDGPDRSLAHLMREDGAAVTQRTTLPPLNHWLSNGSTRPLTGEIVTLHAHEGASLTVLVLSWRADGRPQTVTVAFPAEMTTEHRDVLIALDHAHRLWRDGAVLTPPAPSHVSPVATIAAWNSRDHVPTARPTSRPGERANPVKIDRRPCVSRFDLAHLDAVDDECTPQRRTRRTATVRRHAEPYRFGTSTETEIAP